MFYVLSKLGFLFLRPSNALILALLLGAALRLFGWRRRGAELIGIALGVLVVCAWTGVPTLLLRPLEQRFPMPADPGHLNPAGILVLGGVIDTGLTTERRSTELIDGAERVIVAAELARRYPQARILLSGGSNGVFANDEIAESVLARDLLIEFGVPAGRITIEDRSRNTHENAVFSFAAVEPTPRDQWLLVTSAFHMPRAIGTFRAAGWNGVVAWPVDYRNGADTSWFGGRTAAEGLTMTDMAVREWIGLIAYRFAGYTDALLPRP
ncbi:conserved hypothetical protein [uncultured Pleomorphomonas sp.]|uniref:DUF218 domain-containing protein n=1 Tax=uncultured Pleomorphomonas sp. TaxID=442121 RepID=A0A212LC63_9HYPH|nr:YdcF family protein [uncultured Pleomorphomonas sp.]SCM75151.1 conserved hypothetical protein [uncultured Pleomorphomonas sp.]